jgi:hypothetical protein
LIKKIWCLPRSEQFYFIIGAKKKLLMFKIHSGPVGGQSQKWASTVGPLGRNSPKWALGRICFCFCTKSEFFLPSNTTPEGGTTAK